MCAALEPARCPRYCFSLGFLSNMGDLCVTILMSRQEITITRLSYNCPDETYFSFFPCPHCRLIIGMAASRGNELSNQTVVCCKQ